MSCGETCGPVCQHPSCWSADRERLRQAYYRQTSPVKVDYSPKPSESTFREHHECTLPTYKIINLGDVVQNGDILPRDGEELEPSHDSNTTLFSDVSSDNATHLSKSFKQELSSKFFSSSKTSRKWSNGFPSTPWVTPSSSKLGHSANDGNKQEESTSNNNPPIKSVLFPVLSVKHSDDDHIINQYPHFIWIPSRRKKKKKATDLAKESEENTKLSLKCLDGDLLGLESWTSCKINAGRGKSSHYSTCSQKAYTKNFARKLPPLDTQLPLRYVISQKTQRSNGEIGIDVEGHNPLTLSCTDDVTVRVETAADKVGDAADKTESEAEKVWKEAAKVTKLPFEMCPTPSNTRESRRMSLPKKQKNEKEDDSSQEERVHSDSPHLKGALILDHGVLMVPVDYRPTDVAYEGGPPCDPTRQPLNLPRISVPKEYLKQMPVLEHHCRNSIPQYHVPDVQFEPLDGTGATPSIASTDSLIRRISMDLGDEFCDANGISLDVDASSVKAYEKLLQDFPDIASDSRSASGSSDAMEWRFSESLDCPAPTPATATTRALSKELQKIRCQQTIPQSTNYSGDVDIVHEMARNSQVHSGCNVETPIGLDKTASLENQAGAEGHRRTSTLVKDVVPSMNSISGETNNADRLPYEKVNEIKSVSNATAQSMNENTSERYTRPQTANERIAETNDKTLDLPRSAGHTCERSRAVSVSPLPNYNGSKTMGFNAFVKDRPASHSDWRRSSPMKKSQSMPYFRHNNEETGMMKEIDLRSSLTQMPDLDGSDYHRFRSTTKKQPPLLMWTPGRAPPQPGRQPSSDVVPDELMVRSLEIMKKIGRSKVDLSSSLIIERASLNHPRSSVSLGSRNDGNRSSLSTPIVVPTMQLDENQEFADDISISPSKSRSNLQQSSPNLLQEPNTVSMETLPKMEDLVKTQEVGDIESVEEVQIINGVPDNYVGSENDILLDNGDECTLIENANTPTASEGSTRSLSPPHTSLCSNLDRDTPSSYENSETHDMHSVQEIRIPREAPPSSPLLSIVDFTAEIDLNMNLEDELRKAVEGLEGFSFDNLDLESVLSLDAETIHSGLVNDIPMSDFGGSDSPGSDVQISINNEQHASQVSEDDCLHPSSSCDIIRHDGESEAQ